MEKVVTNAAPSSGGYKDRKKKTRTKRVFKIRNFKQIVDAHKNKQYNSIILQ